MGAGKSKGWGAGELLAAGYWLLAWCLVAWWYLVFGTWYLTGRATGCRLLAAGLAPGGCLVFGIWYLVFAQSPMPIPKTPAGSKNTKYQIPSTEIPAARSQQPEALSYQVLYALPSEEISLEPLCTSVMPVPFWPSCMIVSSLAGCQVSLAWVNGSRGRARR